MNQIARQAHTSVSADAPSQDWTGSAFHVVFDAAPYGMLLVANGGIVRSNAALCEMFGYTASELEGQPIETLLPHRFRSDHVAKRDDYASAPSQRPMGKGRDLAARRKDGSEFPVEIGLSAVVTSRGQLVCASVVDITERKRAELRLREMNAQLEEFTHVASHDLRSPIRGIANLIDFIEEDFGAEASEGAIRNLDRMRERTGHMERLIDDLLAYARAGRRSAKTEPVDLRTIVEESLALEPLPVGAEVSVKIDVSSFQGARVAIATVLRNLLSNAIKHHHDAGVMRLSVTAEDEGDFCRIDVADNGPGIPEAAQARVFRLFQTLNTSERKSSGSGLGLAVVQRLVEGHGGSITLLSAEGAGCLFRIWWPRYARSDRDD